MHHMNLHRLPPAAAAIFACLVTMAACQPQSATPSAWVDVMDRSEELWGLVNDHRARRGLSPLQRDPVLDDAAARHSRAMQRSGRISHEGSAERLRSVREALNLRSVAENVASACGHGAQTEAVMFESWLSSSGHRANLEGDYSLGGLGVAAGDDGDNCTYATQIFGQPFGED